MAIDAGTGSVRAIIFDTTGRQIAQAQQEWTHPTDPKYPGSMNFDCQTNWLIIKDCIKKVMQESQIPPKNLKGIATTSMREGFVAYDRFGQELIAFSNTDTRSKSEATWLKENHPDLEKQIYLKTGQTLALNAIPRLIWLKNNEPETYRKIAAINMLSDWITYKLSGKLVAEPSNASTSGILSLKTRKWDLTIPEAVGIKSNIFLPIYESGSLIGAVQPEVSKETGLDPQTKVITGGGDAQLGCIGVGSIYPHQAALFGGSFWQYEFNTKQLKVDPKARLRINCHAIPNMWQIEAIAWNAGLVMRWFRDAFCQDEIYFSQVHDFNFYDLMSPKAAKIPAGSYGMVTTFADVMNFIALKHAAPTFTNFQINSQKYNKFTFFRAIMENAAIITLGHQKAINELTNQKTAELTFAGGSAKSSLWSQIVADVLGIRVKTPQVKEATALGAALLAGVGSGVYPDLPTAVKTTVKFDHLYEPNLKNHAIYEKLYQKWQKVYQAQLKLADQKVTNYMWIAPGVK